MGSWPRSIGGGAPAGGGGVWRWSPNRWSCWRFRSSLPWPRCANGRAWRSAPLLPAVALLAIPLAQSWANTSRALFQQPNYPSIDHPTPWLALAPVLQGASDCAAQIRKTERLGHTSSPRVGPHHRRRGRGRRPGPGHRDRPGRAHGSLGIPAPAESRSGHLADRAGALFALRVRVGDGPVLRVAPARRRSRPGRPRPATLPGLPRQRRRSHRLELPPHGASGPTGCRSSSCWACAWPAPSQAHLGLPATWAGSEVDSGETQPNGGSARCGRSAGLADGRRTRGRPGSVGSSGSRWDAARRQGARLGRRRGRGRRRCRRPLGDLTLRLCRRRRRAADGLCRRRTRQRAGRRREPAAKVVIVRRHREAR